MENGVTGIDATYAGVIPLKPDQVRLVRLRG